MKSVLELLLNEENPSFKAVSITSKQPGRRSHAYADLRFEMGGYVADIVIDEKTEPPIHHWIIQKAGSPEILYWGQEPTLEEAKSAAYSCMENLIGRESRVA